MPNHLNLISLFIYLFHSHNKNPSLIFQLHPAENKTTVKEENLQKPPISLKIENANQHFS